MQQVKLIFKIRVSFIFFFSGVLIAGTVQENRENRLQEHIRVTEVTGVKSENVIKASNGNIYIQNARVYTGSEESPDGKVSVKTNSSTRKVVIKNVKVHSRNNHTSSNEASNAILSVETSGNTEVIIKDSSVKSHNVTLHNKGRKENICAGALCIQSSENSHIVVDNVKITTDSTDVSIDSSTNQGKKCAGALCIQTEGSEVNVIDSEITSYGSNEFKINE